jgi:hypothetical protein
MFTSVVAKKYVGADLGDKYREMNRLAVLSMEARMVRDLVVGAAHSLRMPRWSAPRARMVCAGAEIFFVADLHPASREGPRRVGEILRCALRSADHPRRL